MQVCYSGWEQKLSMAELRVTRFELGHSIIWHLDRYPNRVCVRIAGLGAVEPNKVAAEHPLLGPVGLGS
jgi:hypothetical protein